MSDKYNTVENEEDIHVTHHGMTIKNDEVFSHAKDPVTTETKDEDKLVQVKDLLDLAIKMKASDIHMSEGQPIIFRISGKLTKIDGVKALTRKQMEYIVLSMMKKGDMSLLEDKKDIDLSYEYVDGSMFRMNIFYKRGRLSAVFRLIGNRIKSYDELNLPVLCQKFLRQKQGLVMITGPTGSGKTTSLSAMIDWINERFSYHIVTLEDPIEVVFTGKKSIFSQRELKSDTESMADALKSVLRQDPDIVVIAEMRDPETIMAAMNICETGHLVFGTMHTSGADHTVSRMVSAFPPQQERQILDKLADNLVGVLSQRLVTKIGGGRVPVFEIFENTSAISNLIRSNDIKQINNAITTSGNQGMFTMEKYAEGLIQQGVIDQDDIAGLFDDEEIETEGAGG